MEHLQKVQESCSKYSESVQSILDNELVELQKDRERKHSLFLEQKEQAKVAHDKAELDRKNKIQEQLTLKRDQQQMVRDELENCMEKNKNTENI